MIDSKIVEKRRSYAVFWHFHKILEYEKFIKSAERLKFRVKGRTILVQINKEQFDKLKDAGLIKYGSEKNFVVANRHKKHGYKSYYVVESKPIMRLLGLRWTWR